MKETITKYKNPIKILLTLLMASITYYFICTSGTIKTYSLVSWLLFFGLIILFIKTDIYNKKLKKEILILSVLFSFLIVFGEISYAFQEQKELSVFRELLNLNNAINFISYFNLLFIILTNLLPKLYDYTLTNKKSLINKSRIVFIISFLVILVCWIPYFLSFFPGTLSPDSLSELNTIINGFKSVSDHHPVLHIIFIAIPYNIGFKVFGSISSGVAVATITQMITMATIFSSFIVFLHRRKVNDLILLIITLFYAIMPVHGYYSIVMWKDVIFAGLLLLLTMETYKIIEKEKCGKLSYKNLVSFIIISILCIFFRNNAIYMYIFLATVTLFLFKKYYKMFIPVFAIVFIVFVLVKGPVFNYFNISKSASAEYIGMPLQQIGRMAYKNARFNESEKELINKLIPLEIMKDAYNPRVSDGIKFNENYNAEAFDNNKLEYFKLWLKLIIKYPTTALEAYSISTLGYWYPGVEYWSVANNIWENKYNIETEPKVPQYVQDLLIKLESRQMPILNIEWSIGLYFWIILFFAIVSIKKNTIIGIYPYIPVCGIWITMMVASPVFGEFRYIYGIVTTLPLLLIVPYLINKKTENGK